MAENIPINITFNVLGNLSANFQNMNKSIQNMDRNLQKTTKQTSAFSSAMSTAAGVLMRDMVRGITNTVSEMFTLGAKVVSLEAAFSTLVRTTGGTTLTLDKLRKATRGTVSDVDLLTSANTALSLGLPTDQLDELYAAAMKLGRGMGIDTKFAVDSLSRGIGRQSKLILDNLGIVFKAEDAYSWYAKQLGVTASALDETERSLAWQSYAIDMVVKRADELGDVQDEAISAQERWTASIQNFTTRVGEVFAPLSMFKGAIDMLMPAMSIVAIQLLPKMVASIGTYITAHGGLVGAIMAVTKALYAKAAAGIAALVALGPAGWAAIAVGVGVAAVAIYALTRNMGGAASGAEELADAVTQATSALALEATTIADITTKITALRSAHTALDSRIQDLNQELANMKSNLDGVYESTVLASAASGMHSSVQVGLKNKVVDLEEAYANLKDSTDIETAAIQAEIVVILSELDALENLERVRQKYNLAQAETADNLDAIAVAWDAAFGGGEIEEATDIISAFAEQCEISFESAERIVSSKSEAMSKAISEIIDKSVLQEAQDKFEEFTDCITGKMFTMDTDVTGAMAGLASNINTLISEGLLGEAQGQIAAYVECSSSKIYDMVTDIEGYMTKLTEDHEEKIAEMATRAETLTGKEKDAVLYQIDLLTSEYKAKMGNLQRWLDDLLPSLIPSMAVGDLQSQLSGAMGKIIPRGGRVPLQLGGIVTRPTAALIAEHEPEAVIPLREFGKMGDTNISIAVTVEGSVDRRTAEYTAKVIEERLKNVLVEASSASGASDHKRIRFISRVG